MNFENKPHSNKPINMLLLYLCRSMHCQLRELLCLVHVQMPMVACIRFHCATVKKKHKYFHDFVLVFHFLNNFFISKRDPSSQT